MLSARNYYRRLIAVDFLAGEQDMDNVPGLIYALGDPDFRVCLEAHDGSHPISRRIDPPTHQIPRGGDRGIRGLCLLPSKPRFGWNTMI